MYEMLTEEASPHAAFYNPKVAPNELPRESIDCRAFVFYIDLPKYPPVVEDIFQIFQDTFVTILRPSCTQYEQDKLSVSVLAQ